MSLWSEATVHAAGMWEPSYALGDSLREAGDCARAVPAYRTVIDMRPAHRDAHTNLGICLAQTGQLEEADREFRRALEIDPDFARGYTNLAALALVEGDADRARGFYVQALEHDRGNVFARLQLASLFEHTLQGLPFGGAHVRRGAPAGAGHAGRCRMRPAQRAARGRTRRRAVARMRVLHAIHDFLPRHRAGSEIYAFELAREQSARHDVFVLAAEYDPAAAHGTLRWRTMAA